MRNLAGRGGNSHDFLRAFCYYRRGLHFAPRAHNPLRRSPVIVVGQAFFETVHIVPGPSRIIQFHVPIGQFFQRQEPGLMVITLHQSGGVLFGEPCKLLEVFLIPIVCNDAGIILVGIVQNNWIGTAVDCSNGKVLGVIFQKPCD